MPKSKQPPKVKKSGKSKKAGSAPPNSKAPPPVKSSKTKGSSKTKSANNNNANSDNSRGNERVPPSKTLILIWLLVGGELALDLFSTVVAFIAMLNEFECCDETVELGGLPLGITLPFFILIVIEIVILLLNIKHNLFMTRSMQAIEEAISKADTSWTKFLGVTRRQKMINVLLSVNPFFGFMVAWLLLYQSNKRECFIVLGFEAGSLLLHWLSIYFEGNPQTRLSIAFHCIPIIPFLATVIVIVVSLNQSGVCYLLEQELFWYKGCQVCRDNLPLGDREVCPDGSQGERKTYCGTDGDSACFFQY